MSPPPSERGDRSHDPGPSGPLGPGPRVKTCLSSCLSWLHPLMSWSLRQTRGGSVLNACQLYCGTKAWAFADAQPVVVDDQRPRALTFTIKQASFIAYRLQHTTHSRSSPTIREHF